MRHWRQAKRVWLLLAVAVTAGILWLFLPTGTTGSINPYSPDEAWRGMPHPTPIEIAGQLAAAGAVRSPLALRLVWKATGGDREIRLGPVSWERGDWPWEIAQRLAQDRPDYVRVTLPQGISTAAAANRLCSSFLESPGLVASCGQRLLETSSAWALAETYRFDRNSWAGVGTGGGVGAGLLASHQRELISQVFVAGINRYQSEVWDYLVGTGLEGERSEVVALAGLVAAEAALDSERARIAGVINNRLAAGMPLQIDASALYCLELAGRERPTRVLLGHLQEDCPFNTYLHKGLPPGPIALPGRRSLAAALAPEKHGYLYYVLDGDGPGHLFAADLTTHNRNVQISRSRRSP